MGLTHAHTAIYKIDKQQGPSYSTGNYTQYSVITYNGKEYIYKLTQHCKSTILQFLKINYIV